MSEREWVRIGEDSHSVTWAMPILRSGASGTLVRVDVYQDRIDEDGDLVYTLAATSMIAIGATLEELQR